jgi:hypothetical protein|tara:strand:- start:1943 stop:3481 length:1539 start_codon:yes stop_codon:yes gene_type:complete
MAQHDQNLANASGSAFRADLNNALSAIFSNSSGATEPSVTTAYMWWADTTANQMKIRNSNNDGWITLRELDGTILMQDGSAASPSLCFRTDTDTGFYKDGDNRIGIATGGVERATILDAGFIINDAGNDCNFRVESSGDANILFVDGGEDRVGIGDSAPSEKLNVAGNVMLEGGDQYLYLTNAGTGNSGIYIRGNTSSSYLRSHSTGIFTWEVTGSEKMRLDSSGRLLLGASSSVSPNRNFQIAGNMSICANLNSADGVTVDYIKSRNTTYGSNTIVQDDDTIAKIQFRADDGSDYLTQAAQIAAEVDGTPGSNDMPGRLLFLTTQDGASSPDEKMRIFATGQAHHFTTGSGVFVGSSQGAGTTNWLFRGNRNRTNNTSGGVTVFYVYTNGNVQNTNNSYGQISDVKLKENIVNANSQWDDIKGVQVRNFNFKEETGHSTHTQIGVVAQELETVSPGLVYDTPDRDEEGNDLGTVTKGVNYSVLYMKAVKALQEAMERIETLEAKVAALEAG